MGSCENGVVYAQLLQFVHAAVIPATRLHAARHAAGCHRVMHARAVLIDVHNHKLLPIRVFFMSSQVLPYPAQGNAQQQSQR